MKTLRLISALCMAGAISLGIASCSKEESEEKGLLDGTWSITADEWKGIVNFDKDAYRIEEYHDDYGYGFYTYKGNFYGTVKYYTNQIALFSSESKGWLGEDNYVSCIAGKKWNKPSTVADNMTIKGDDGKEYQFKRTTGTTSQRSDIYGVWQWSHCSGSVYTCVNGNKGTYIEDVAQGSLSNIPGEIGISQSALKNADGYNAYIISNKGKSFENTYLAKISLQGQRISASSSDYSWFDERYTWNVMSVNENELKVSVEGPDSPRKTDCQYLDLVFVFKRVKTL